MKINFNNVRKHAVINYEKLVEKLNNSITTNEYGYKMIQIDANDIQKYLDDLRFDLIAIACTFEDDSDEFSDLSDEIGDVLHFNNEDDE